MDTYISKSRFNALPATPENRDAIIAWGYPYDSIMGGTPTIVYDIGLGMVCAVIPADQFEASYELIDQALNQYAPVGA